MGQGAQQLDITQWQPTGFPPGDSAGRVAAASAELSLAPPSGSAGDPDHGARFILLLQQGRDDPTGHSQPHRHLFHGLLALALPPQ